MFWRRATADSAFAALLVGLVGGIVLFISNVILQFTHIHFLYIAPILFLLSLGVVIFVSLRGVPAEGVEELMWNGGVREKHGQTEIHWYSDFRFLSILLLVLTAIIVGTFS